MIYETDKQAQERQPWVKVQLRRPELLRALETMIGVLKRQDKKEVNEGIRNYIKFDIDTYEKAKLTVTELEEQVKK